MCLGLKDCHGIPAGFRVVELIFQARVHDYNTDDLVCRVENDFGNSLQVLMQMKSALSPGDAAFKEAVGLAWLDFKTGVVKPDVDRLVIAYDVGSLDKMEGAADIAKLAQSSTRVTSFELKASASDVSNEKKRKALVAIKAAIAHYNEGVAAPDEQVFRFLQHLDFLHHDMNSDGTEAVSMCRQQISVAMQMQGRPELAANLVWSNLVATCGELNGRGSEVDLANLHLQLDRDLVYRFAAHRARQAQSHLSAVAVAVAELQSAPAALPLRPTASTNRPTDPGGGDLIPTAREASANKFISRRLDSIAAMTRSGRYADALKDLDELSQDFEALDSHQQARWYLIHATSVWNVHSADKQAGDEFLRAADLCEDDDKLAAARIRGHLIKGEIDKSLEAARKATERFPTSITVWVAFTNARILAGEAVTVADIPADHSDQAAAYDVVASGHRQAGDIAKALETSLTALDMKDATFFTREATLRFALELATQNPINVLFRVRDEKSTAVLARIAGEFTPREEKLWAVQSPKHVSAAATHLAWTYILLGDAEEALKVISEVESRNVDTEGTIYRAQIEAMRELGREPEALKLTRPNVSKMPADTLASFAQLAADLLDADALNDAKSQALKRESLAERRSELLQTFDVLRWDMLLRTDQAELVRRESVNQGVLAGTSFEQAIVAARAFLRAQDPASAQPYLALSRRLAKESDRPGASYLLAQLLMESQSLREAAEVLCEVLPKNSFSEPHERLLYCYIRTGQKAKARDLIRSFPAGWAKERNARQMAIELGQAAGDWDLLRSLVPDQLEDCPGAAMSWLFRLFVATRDLAGDTALVGIPEVLTGRVREVTQLASAEIRGGQVDPGLRRLYRLRRQNLGNIEAAAGYFTAFAFAPSELPVLAREMKTVEPGCSVCLVNEDGEEFWRTVDPPGMPDLSPTEEFCAPDSMEAKPLLGLAVGDELTQGDQLGVESRLVVSAITSAYHRLMALADSVLKGPSAGKSPIGRMQVLDNEGNFNPEPMVRQLEAQASRHSERFKLYESGGFTLGALARMVGSDEFTLVRGWPSDGPPLYASGGRMEERQSAVEALLRAERCVVDITALTELALLGHLDLLAELPDVLVTAATRDFIEQELTELDTFPSAGRSFLHNGQLAFIETTEESLAAERAFLQSLRDAVERHARVIPAYGPLEVNEVLAKLGDVLSGLEYATLLAAIEHDALLFSLDARLRAFAAGFGREGLWPQVFLIAMRNQGKLSLPQYALASIFEFVRRRTFITLDNGDLEFALVQNRSLTNLFFERLRSYLTDPEVEFASVARVVIEFLAGIYVRGAAQFGVMLELLAYLLEALLAHKQCPPRFENQLVGGVAFRLGEALTGPMLGSLQQIAALAVARRKQAPAPFNLKAQVVYCSFPPTVLNGLTDDEVKSILALQLPPENVSAPIDEVRASTSGREGGKAR